MLNLKLVAFCAHFIAAAHCHVWQAGDHLPNWYITSVEITWDKDYRPHLGTSPCTTFQGDAVTWWSGRTLNVRHIGKGALDTPRGCYLIYRGDWTTLNGGSFMMHDLPLFIDTNGVTLNNINLDYRGDCLATCSKIELGK